jgi:HipA-like C-terminal domain
VSRQLVNQLLRRSPAGDVLSAGLARRARYALRRPLRGELADIPLYAIDDAGSARVLGALSLVAPEGTLLPLEATAWPVPAQSRDGWWDGLPYPVHSIRPQGYLGREFAHNEHRTLGVSANPDEWTDDDILWVLSRRGADTVGNLVLGNEAYSLWLERKLALPDSIPPKRLAEAYLRRAEDAVARAGSGSSAAGEFPKFTARRDLPGASTPHVIVKFSGAGQSATERRWGDLLVCEHLALERAHQLPGVSTARSRILTFAGRVFIEVERFDRVGMHGRLPQCGLDALSPAFLGSTRTQWPELVGELHRMGLVAATDMAAVEYLWWFGRLIANADMHLGNLSFHVQETLRLTPAYDMLPMAYAPLPGGELPVREFAPALPLPREQPAWLAAAREAVAFWSAAASDLRISEAFRALCQANASRLQDIAGKL